MSVFEVLEEIKKTRVKNNDLWMDILEIALTRAPSATRSVIEEIRKNDKKITNLMEKI